MSDDLYSVNPSTLCCSAASTAALRLPERSHAVMNMKNELGVRRLMPRSRARQLSPPKPTVSMKT